MYQSSFVPFSHLTTEYIHNIKKSDMKIQHYHDAYELYLQTAGERILILNDHRYLLRPGDLYIIRPFELHYTQSSASGSYDRYLVSIPPHGLSPILTEAEASSLLKRLDSCVLHLDPEQAASAQNFFRDAHTHSLQKGFLARKFFCCSVLLLLEYLSGLLADPQIRENLNGEMIPAQLAPVLHHINQHYSSPLTLEEAASLAHMSRYHFCRQFHEATGASFLEYLYNVRLSQAHQLLVDTDLSLGEISIQCGFSSAAHLSRVFRSSYGLSPSAFRKLL